MKKYQFESLFRYALAGVSQCGLVDDPGMYERKAVNELLDDPTFFPDELPQLVEIPGSQGAVIQRWAAVEHLGITPPGYNALVIVYSKETLLPLCFGDSGPFKTLVGDRNRNSFF